VEIVRAWKLVILVATDTVLNWDALYVPCAIRNLKTCRCCMCVYCLGESTVCVRGSALLTDHMNLKRISAHTTNISVVTFSWIRHLGILETKKQVLLSDILCKRKSRKCVLNAVAVSRD
jgi:hypothetical protein